MKRVAVLGEGAWGTAVACVLADNGHAVTLWCHDDAVSRGIQQEHCNERYMSGVDLSHAIIATPSLAQALDQAEWVFVSTPVLFLREVLGSAAVHYSASQCWVLLSKGVENDTGALPLTIAQEVLARDVAVAVLAGPSFAREVANRQLTGVVIAATDQLLAHQAACMVANDYMRVALSRDVIGVQCGGAFKNAMAVLIGVAQGAGWADNTRALLLTYGWQEVIRLSLALGAQRDTLIGLAGMGDLFLTLTGHHSKNFSVGCKLGSGVALAQIIAEIGYVPEGVNTLKTMQQLMQRHALTLPLFERLHQVVFAAASPMILLPAIVPSVACAVQ